jgi:hypothetical protein
MDSLAGGSPRRLARLAGALYLISILGGVFAITIVPAMLVVQGDVAATAHSIQTHELLYVKPTVFPHAVANDLPARTAAVLAASSGPSP